MAIDPVKAIDLVERLENAANGYESDARALASPLAEAASLLGADVPDASSGLRRVAQDLRDNSADLRERARMVLAGGPEFNEGLAAVERVRARFDFIESRGDRTSADGILSREDLLWARRHTDSETAEAAAWLLDHDRFFGQLETALHNDEYLESLDNGVFSFDSGDRDARMSIDDIDAFLDKVGAWSVLLPHVGEIDTAYLGGQRDGFCSREDFQAYLMNYDPSPEVAAAVTQVLDDGAYHRHGSALDLGTLLDVVSFVPVIGDVIDGGRAIYYALHGDYATASLFALALVPLPGLSSTGIRGAVNTIGTVTSIARKSGANAAVREAGRIAVKDTAINYTAYASTKKAVDALDSTVELADSIDDVLDEALTERAADELEEHLGPISRQSLENQLEEYLSIGLGEEARSFLSESNHVISQRLLEHRANEFAFSARTPR